MERATLTGLKTKEVKPSFGVFIRSEMMEGCHFESGGRVLSRLSRVCNVSLGAWNLRPGKTDRKALENVQQTIFHA